MIRRHKTVISASAQNMKFILGSGDEELPSPSSVWFLNPSGVLTEASKAQLASTYAHLNPVRLLKQVNDNVEHLWQLRERHPGEKILLTKESAR